MSFKFQEYTALCTAQTCACLSRCHQASGSRAAPKKGELQEPEETSREKAEREASRGQAPLRRGACLCGCALITSTDDDSADRSVCPPLGRLRWAWFVHLLENKGTTTYGGGRSQVREQMNACFFSKLAFLIIKVA